MEVLSGEKRLLHGLIAGDMGQQPQLNKFNINSPKQLGEGLFERLGLPHGKKAA